MKKKFNTNTIYFLVPLVMLALFTPIYLVAKHSTEQKLEAMAARERSEKEAKIEAENRLKAKAIDEANAATARHNAEIHAKQLHESQKNEERQRLIEIRDRTRQEQFAQETKVANLQRDVTAVQDEVRKIEGDMAKLTQDKGFLVGYVKETQAGRAALTEVLEKIKHANQQAELARAALANALKNKND